MDHRRFALRASDEITFPDDEDNPQQFSHMPLNWKEELHPRGQTENKGEFATSRGAGTPHPTVDPPGQRSESVDSAASATAVFRNHLEVAIQQGRIKPEQAEQYANAATQVFARMTPAARQALRTNVSNTVFFQDVQSLSTAVEKISGTRLQGKTLGAFHGDGYGILLLDFDGTSGRETDTASHIYAHEFGHAVDWIPPQGKNTEGRRISSTQEWTRAWKKELGKGYLTMYAASSGSEGFAEFARLCWTTPDKASAFPQCYTIFKKYGLVQ